MKIILRCQALLKALQIINGIIEKKQIRPILANALLAVSDNQLTLTATDTEIELIGSAATEEVIQPGAITAPARKLYEICRALPEGAAVNLSLDNERLILQSHSSRFSLATLAAHDFPVIEEKSLAGQFTTSLQIAQAELRQLLYKTSFAMGQQDVRHYLNGAVFELNPGRAECMTTDGHRFALSRINDAAVVAKSKILLPRKSVLELMRLLNADDHQPVTMAVNDHYLRVNAPEFIFTSKLIQTALPDYHKLIPPQGEQQVVIDRESLRQALVRVSILSHEKFRSIKWELTPGQLKITANNPEREEAEELVPAEYPGPAVEASFNVTYLLDVLSTLQSEKITFSFSNLEDGILIQPADELNTSLYVVMPLVVPQTEAV